MNEVLKHIELIENYAEGKLSAQEIHDFETRLLIDSNFKEEYNLYKSVVAGIKSSGEQNIKVKLKEVDLEMDSENVVTFNPEKKKNNRFYYSIAAGIVLILGISFIWKLNSTGGLPAMANSIYEKDKGLPVEMSVVASDYAVIINNYKTGEYKVAEKLLLNLEKKNPTNDTINFYLGLVDYELDSFKDAESHFIMINTSSIFYEKAEFRLLLVYLKQNLKEKANSVCQKIVSNPSHSYFDKAKLVSKQLLSH